MRVATGAALLVGLVGGVLLDWQFVARPTALELVRNQVMSCQKDHRK